MDSEPESIFLDYNIDWIIVSGTISLVILLILSGLISGSEIAFFSLSKSDLDKKDDNSKKNTIIELLQKPKKLLATILIANNFINILFILLFAHVGEYYFENISSNSW